MTLQLATLKLATAETFNVTLADLEGPCRKRIYARPRQAAMHLARELTTLSTTAIGRAFNRDHTTVINASWRVAQFRAADVVFLAQMEAVRAKFNADPRHALRRTREAYMRRQVYVDMMHQCRLLALEAMEAAHV